MSFYKLYVVRFNIGEFDSFKIGITRFQDVINRFTHDLLDKKITNFKVIKSGYVHSESEAIKLEDRLMESIFKTFPDNNYYPDPEYPKRGNYHNFFTPIDFSGITETRLYNHKEVRFAVEFLKENTYINYKDFKNGRA